MLNLASVTDPAWLPGALAHLDEILIDHAHCEKKAASSAVRLLFTYADRPALLPPLAELAREELAHFQAVLAALAARGVPFRRQVPSPYASRLLRVVRSHEPARLLDTLLCMALIESRSCERMTLLADALDDEALAGLYRSLLASEARHHRTYVELATTLAPAAAVRTRLAQIACHEAQVLAAIPAVPRLHAPGSAAPTGVATRSECNRPGSALYKRQE